MKTWLVVALAVLGCAKKGSKPVPRCLDLSSCALACKPCEQGDCDPGAAANCRELAELHMRGQPPQFDIGEATRLLLLACERGDLRSCSAAGNQLQDGRGAARDVERAIALYEKSCEGGVGVGCFNLAMMLEGARGVTSQPDRAKTLYQQAASHYANECKTGGDLSWCVNHGVLFENGYGVERNVERAAEIYKTGCDGGNSDSCVNLILLDLQTPERPKPTDIAIPLETLQKGCDGGSRLSCGVLGALLLKGRHGVTKDPSRAASLLKRACDDGERNACFTLGGAQLLGGDQSELASAIALFKRACELGAADSCVIIAQMAIDRAPGLSQADQLTYFGKACDIGNGEGCAFVGAIYMLGNGVAKDEARGIRFTSDGCRLGYPGACVDLIRRGIDLPLPPDRKRRILDGACRNGVAQACKPEL